MRKQTKVLAAAALFTLGASFSAFAAKTGRWVLEDEGWMCYDKDGDPYTNEWCLSAGKEFYVGDDGVMVTSDWVEHDNKYYYVGSEGTKTKNDWRYVTPIDDEDADEEWFFFDNKGKRVDEKKKVIGGKSYYFNKEGIMLTGWVDTSTYDEKDNAGVEDTVYCGEDGARLEKEWIKTYGPEVDVEEDDLDDETMYWYWINNDGTPATGKKANIKGQTYLFNTEGHMLTGWVAATTADAEGGKTVTVYDEIGTDEVSEDDTLDTYGAVYFCGGSDDGHVKKNTWIKTWRNTEYDAANDDNDQYWFWINKEGVVFKPASTVSAVDYSFKEGKLKAGDALTVFEKVLNKKTYLFNEQGEMVDGFVKVGSDMYYFGGEDDGARKTGSLTISDDCDESYKFCFATDDDAENGYKEAVGVTGAKGGKLYRDGLLLTAENYKYEIKTVLGKNFIVNNNGAIQTTYKVYKDGDRELDFSDKDAWVFHTEKDIASNLKGYYEAKSE